MIATQPFGKTGHDSTRTIFGGAALGDVSQEQADRTLDVLLQYGVNHLDTAASYGNSELRIGRWMPQYRDRFFLATKTGDRNYQGARDSIHRSLERLRTDHVDLIQLHNLVDPIEWDEALSPGGALDACIEAREQGLVRFIGVTGHGLSIAAMHQRSLERFPFDSVLLPYNYLIMQDAKYSFDFNALYIYARENQIAFQTIKSLARRPWWGREHTASTWYEPITEQDDIDVAVHWVLGRPGVFLNTPADIELLPKVLDAASRFQEPASDEAMHRVMVKEEMQPLFV